MALAWVRSVLFGATLLALTFSQLQPAIAANFVVERSQLRVKGEGFAGSFPSAIGDVSLTSAFAL